MFARGPCRQADFFPVDAGVSDYSPAMPAAFFLNSWPNLIYFMVVSNYLCRSWRWMACPGASFADAEVARPDRSEWPANRAAAASASSVVAPFSISAARIDRLTMRATALSVRASPLMLPCRSIARKAGPDVMPVPGDRVICLEWFGDGPLPAPRWHEKGFKHDSIESEYLIRAVRQRVEDREDREDGHPRQREPGFAEPPHFPVDRVHELSFSDLVHMLFGVATERTERLERMASP